MDSILWNHDFKVEYMFDGNDGTGWHSANRFEQVAKTMRVDFRVWFENLGKISQFIIQRPIDFVMLTVRKRKECCLKRYLNVCLVLNGNTSDQMCTNTPDGFNNDSSPFITWYKPTNNVRTVEVVFRDRQHAQIADLKIFYEPDLYFG